MQKNWDLNDNAFKWINQISRISWIKNSQYIIIIIIIVWADNYTDDLALLANTSVQAEYELQGQGISSKLVTVGILQYGCTTRILIKCIGEKNLDEKYRGMQLTVLNWSGTQQPQIAPVLPLVSHLSKYSYKTKNPGVGGPAGELWT